MCYSTDFLVCINIAPQNNGCGAREIFRKFLKLLPWNLAHLKNYREIVHFSPWIRLVPSYGEEYGLVPVFNGNTSTYLWFTVHTTYITYVSITGYCTPAKWLCGIVVIMPQCWNKNIKTVLLCATGTRKIVVYSVLMCRWWVFVDLRSSTVKALT